MTHERISPPSPAEPARVHHGSPLQRACSCPGGGEDCEECKSKGPMQRHSTAPAAAIPSSVHETLNRGGAPLDASTRGFMESRFGHDFGRVRIHADAQASESARAVHATAYTVGSDIAFRSGRYAPSTTEGRELLAHELAHVVQQNSGAALPQGIDGGPTDPLEIDATAMATQALSDAPPSERLPSRDQRERTNV